MTKLSNNTQFLGNEDYVSKTLADAERSLNHTTSFEISQIPDSLFERLPTMLKTILDQFTGQDKHVLFLSSLGVISGSIPNVYGYYDMRHLYPNLMVFIVAPFGAGKGVMNLAKRLVIPIHKEKLAKGHEHEKLLLHLIPANSSKSALVEALDENNGGGVMFETEGDALADILTKEYGTYSDILRNAFQNEGTSMMRRKDKEVVSIERLTLSIVLSGTFSQMRRLIPSTENGLMSRLITYSLNPTRNFKNVFQDGANDVEKSLDILAESLHILHNHLTMIDAPVIFSFTKEQKNIFLRKFDKTKGQMIDDVGMRVAGVVNRNGAICFKLATLITVLRTYENGSSAVEGNLICSDDDFYLSMEISEVIFEQSMNTFLSPAYADGEEENSDNKMVLNKDVQLVLELHKKKIPYSNIAQDVFGDGVKYKQKVYRIISKNQRKIR